MLHPSKLPQYKGGSPIQNQIIEGKKNLPLHYSE
jgi:methionyl-tRNA formyltransferase|tara:strand:- start:819 stop:920 length:102 start_codon:yes stop_codon:yes gene_type:complete